MATKKKSTFRSMSVSRMADGSGFQISKDHEQSYRGAYKMPETSIAKHHGEVLKQIHDFVKDSGTDSPAEDETACPFCAAPKAGKPGPDKPEKSEKSEKGKKDLSEKAAKAAKG
jgi:hypothetical protein